MNSTLHTKKLAIFWVCATAVFLTPLVVSAQTYDDYLLFTQKAGKTLASGIAQGAENTATLYQSAWNELMSLGGAKIGTSLSSYVDYSNNLGTSFANTLTAGLGASQEFSQKIWSTDPYGRYAVATGNISDAFDGILNYFGSFFKKEPAVESQQPTTTAPKAASPPKPKPTPVATPVVEPKPAAVIPPTLVPKLPRPRLKTAPQGEALAVPAITQRILGGVTSQDLESRIEQLRNELVSKIGAVAGQSQSNYQNNFAAIALTNKIDQLTNTTITTPTITGGSLTNTSISGGSISGTTLSVSSGTFSGNLTVSGTGTSTFAGDSNFDSGTLYVDSLNNRIGIGTSSPSDTLALAGPLYFSQISAPSVTQNRLYNESGNLTWNGTVIGGASTGQWTLSGSDVYRSSGNVGIGTTSPYAKLSVVGEVVASHFTATSTTATSTFANHISIASGKEYRINGNPVLKITGTNGFNAGYLNTTSGAAAVTFGVSNQATSLSAVAMGYGNLATSSTALAIGNTSYAGGSNSIAVGINAQAYEGASIAIGQGVINNTASSLMIGPSDAAKLTILSSGNLGIGTTSPYAKLSVVGETVSSYFTATSTTATSTFQGTLLATSGGNVGIGTTTPSLAKLSVGGTLLASGHVAFGNESSINVADAYAASTNNVLVVKENQTDQSAGITGIYSEAKHTPLTSTAVTGTATISIQGSGILSGSPIAWSGNSGNVYGGFFTGVQNSTLTINNAYGIYAEAYTDSSGGITNAYGGRFTVVNYGGGGTIASAYGVSVANISASGTNTYGVHVATQGSGANNYAFYAAGTTDKSYFGGKIGIGTTTPNNKLDIYSTTKSAIGFSGASGDNYKWTIGMDVTNGGRFSIASSTALGTLDQFVINGAGNVGLGTTSPYAKLSVVGEVVASHFTATSTSVTNTLSGNLLIQNNGPLSYTRIGSDIVNASTPTNLMDTFVVGTSTTGTNNIRAGVFTASYGGGTAGASVQGLNAFSVLNSSATTNLTSTAIGGGLRNRYVTNNNSVGRNVAQQSSVSALIQVDGTTASTTDASDFHAESPTVGADDLLTNFYGLWVRGGVVSGTLTNRYGVYIDDLLGGGTRYGIYQAGSTDNNYFAGNVGLGTTSPYAKLSVVGEVVASHFTATSTTATTTLAGGFTVETSGLVYDYSSNNIGIGTAAPDAPFTLTRSTAVSAGGTIYGGTKSDLSMTGALAGGGTYYGNYTSVSGSGCTACANTYAYGNYITFPADTSSNMGRYGVYVNIVPTAGGSVGVNNAYHAALPGSSSSAVAYSASTGSGFTGKLLDLRISSAQALILNSSGNLGLGTTSPYAKLSVVGETVSTYFTATSTTATSTFMGSLGIGTTTSAINNTLVVQGGVCITAGTTCPSVPSGGLRVDTAGGTVDDPGDVFDVAERYPASETMSAGEIAAIDIATEDKAVVKKGIQGDVLLGIVSTRAAIAINGGDLTLAPAGEATSTKPLIALAGRVPVKVVMEGGPIKKGDRITASGVPGVGMRATSSSQQTVGIALENQDTDGTVLVFVQTSVSRLDPAISNGTILNGTNESSFWNVEEGTGRIKFISQGIDLNDQDIVSVRSIIGSAGKWSIDASGRLVVDEVQANKVTTNTLCVDDVCIGKDALKAIILREGGSAASTQSTPSTPPPPPATSGTTDASSTNDSTTPQDIATSTTDTIQDTATTSTAPQSSTDTSSSSVETGTATTTTQSEDTQTATPSLDTSTTTSTPPADTATTSSSTPQQ